MLSPFLLLSLLFVFATSSLAQVVTVYENFVCAVGEIAYLDAAGVGACGIPATVFLNPTFTRCPSFTYLTLGAD
ncbi:hypothetical protein BDY24DRAFT_380114 [Mrakia frigida]|uniref:uncharacterized protein n=1 Tax=Mrakia frigida TaxID=29902 RepID=UPI003FCC24D2